jgi:pyruvate dehydrogenase E2 component (dihydrolipoamide acetyltransferase)
MATGILMPKQGNTVEECVLTEWRIAKGDSVSEGDIIADIETDKATFEVEATASGTVLDLFWEEGDLVPVLVNICAVGEPGEDVGDLRPDGAEAAAPAEDAGDSKAAPAAEEPPTPAEPAEETPAPQAAGAAETPKAGQAPEAPLSPRARKFLREHPFNLPAIQGSGAGGRIIEQDVKDAYQQAAKLSPAAAAMQAEGVAAPAEGTGVGGMIRTVDMGREAPPAAAAPVVPPAEDTVEKKPLPNIRKIIAQRLHESLASMAQYTLNAEADVSGLLALRAQIKDGREALGLANVNIGDMVMFATIKALLRHPEINAEFIDNVVHQHSAVHMGFACDTPRGLMVPVLENAQALSLGQLSAQVKDLASQAIEGRLNPDRLQGGTFTVSNLGAFGITTFTPVINAPQVGILGVGNTILRPVRTKDGIEHRDMLQLSLTLNHMVIDGAPGARFLQTLKAMLENFTLVCLAG